MESKTFEVPNISCEHCVHTIQSEIGELQGVESVKADEQTRIVTVQWNDPASWAQIQQTLTEINYPPAETRN
ncbi:MAG TPA: heavy metal-associated domain-containing protein [Aggregatilineales bacterium]|nr:heavy metal-associated domain-containing protein [Aggregatilineales bacterium]